MKLFIRLTGIATFLVLLLFAFLFYKERTLTFDMAYQEFYIIFKNNFVLNIRFGSLIPQIFPVIFRWLNCPLKQILLAHSLGFVIYYFSFFAIITFLLKEHWVALLFLLFPLLLVNDTFYWIQSELPQGLAFLILYYGYLEKKTSFDINRRPVPHLFLLLFIQFFHPLLIMPILFVLIYTLHKTYQSDFRQYIKPVSLAIVSFGIRYLAGKFNAYEHSRFDISAALKNNLPHLLTLPSVQNLVHYAIGDHLVYWVLLALTLAVLIIQKRLYLAFLLGVFTFGYLLLICITNPAADKFYFENMILPASIFLLLPFTDFVLKKLSVFRPAFIIFVMAIIIIRLYSIYETHSRYTNRLNWYSSMFLIMEKNNTQRMMLSESEVPMDTLIMSWSSGYETLLLSSIEGPSHVKSLVISHDLSKFSRYMKYDFLLIAEWDVKLIKELPNRYFNLMSGRYMHQQLVYSYGY